MKKNSIVLREHYKDGTSFLYEAFTFYVGNTETENLAVCLAAYEAKECFDNDCVDKIDLCYADAEWNFEVDESKILYEYEITPTIVEWILTNSMPSIKAAGNILQVLPDYCYNGHLYKKLRKIRKNGKCIDWTKQNRDLEWDNNSWWYLHGELESKVGYDKAVIINATAAKDTIETLRWFEIRGDRCVSYRDTPLREMYVNGIRKCNVIGVHGDCLGFFWTVRERTVEYDKGTFNTWEQRGLVVQRNDTRAVLQAYHSFLMKEENL